MTKTTSMPPYSLRESWLQAAVELVRPLFAAKQHVSRERPRAKCAKCGYQVPMLRKFVSYGPPICPKDRIEMEQVGDWAQD